MEKTEHEKQKKLLIQIQARVAELSQAVEESTYESNKIKIDFENMKIEVVRNSELLIKSQVDIIANLRSELSSRLGKNSSDMKELSEKVVLVENMLSIIKEKLTEAETKLALAKSELEEAEAKLSVSEEKVKVLENENLIFRNQLMSKSEDSSGVIAKFNKSLTEAKAALEAKQKEIIIIKESKK